MGDNHSTLDDDFLDLRFDPRYREIFKEKIESLQGEAVGKDYRVPVNFSGRFDPKVERILTNMVGRVFVNAAIHGLALRRSNAAVCFYTENSWKEYKPEKTGLSLPASMIDKQGTQSVVHVIIPLEIKSSETLIKTVRLLFSKLFGSLFFRENVPSRRPYHEAFWLADQLSFDTLEKAHFNRLLDSYPDSAVGDLRKFTPNKALSGEKSLEYGKREFYRRFEEKGGATNSTTQELLEDIFSQHTQLAEADSEAFFQRVSEKVYANLPKIGLILPHEEKRYMSLKNRKRWELFDGIADKLEYIQACLNDLYECFDYLERNKAAGLTDFGISDYWVNVINNRILHIKRKGLVKLFLIDDSRLTLNQEKERIGFPFWVWRKRIFDNYPKDLPPDRVLKQITNHYRNSIYQKIFEASFRAVTCLKRLQRQKSSDISQTPDYLTLKSLIAGIRVRQPLINDMLDTCRISPQMVRKNDKAPQRIEEALKFYESGWSYFVSFALIHQFYLSQPSPGKEKGETFRLIVQQHVEKRLEKQLPMQISYLFMLLYFKWHFELDRLIEIIKKGSETIDFFILHQPSIIKRNQPIREIIHSFAEKL